MNSLQQFLRKASEGELAGIEGSRHQRFNPSVKVTGEALTASIPHMYLWLDYLCIPQPGAVEVPPMSDEPVNAEWSEFDSRSPAEGNGSNVVSLSHADQVNLCSAVSSGLQHAATLALSQATSSLPSYVERSACVLVLAPSCGSAPGGVRDYQSWRSRGWCRTELIAARLCVNPVRVMIVQGGDAATEFVSSEDTNLLLAGEGSFSCCSRGRGHAECGVGEGGEGEEEGDKKPPPCDKVAVRAALDEMLDTKINFLLALRGDPQVLAEARFLEMARHWLLRGLPDPVIAPEDEETARPSEITTVAGLKVRLRCRDEYEESVWTGATGWTLLHSAALCGSLGAVKSLVAEQPKSVNAALKNDVPSCALYKGTTPLCFAMMFASWDVAAALLDAGASPKARDSQGNGAFMLACGLGRSENMRAWLARFPNWDLDGRRHKSTGVNALGCAGE